MLSRAVIERVLSTALKTGGDWADLFLEETRRNQANFSDRAVKSLANSTRSGAGLRVVDQKKEYYAYTNDLSEDGLLRIAKTLAETLGKDVQQTRVISLEKDSRTAAAQHKAPPPQWSDKVALLRRADEATRALSPAIVQVNGTLLDEQQSVLIANSNGLVKEDCRTRARFALTAVAGDGDERQMGNVSPGAASGSEFFATLDIPKLAAEAGESALRMLAAPYAPKGKMAVIIDSGFGGVIFHEACGHLLEASAVVKKATVFANSLGQPIAAPCVSAVDDGTQAGSWGSSRLDDEGVPTQRNLLIEDGVLKSFLVDRLSAERLGLVSTGSSRRESYRFSPTSRMNNTFILPGLHRLSQMLAETDLGLYAKKLGGGSVNPATGEFNFAVTEGYLVKDGKILHPVRGAVLIGRGEDILMKIDRVGSELELAAGLCGAASGWVPVCVGQPAIRVQDLLVGGQ